MSRAGAALVALAVALALTEGILAPGPWPPGTTLAGAAGGGLLLVGIAKALARLGLVRPAAGNGGAGD